MAPKTGTSFEDVGYHAPTVQPLGSVEEMTEQFMNKVGSSVDKFTGSTGLNGNIITIP